MCKENSVLVLSGYNIRAVIAFCRWATEKKVIFHIVAKDENDPIFNTIYKEKVAITRQSKALEVLEVNQWINSIRVKFGFQKIVLLPVTEYYNRFLLDNRNKIECNDVIIPLCESQLYKDISDKYSFGKVCEDNNLQTPKEYNFQPQSYPFVAKPISYYSERKSQIKPYLIYNEKEKEQFSKKENIREFFYQQFISGESHYLLAYVSKNKDAFTFSQENLVQQSNGGSIVLARRSNFHKTSVAEKYIEMLQKIKFTGLIMIEVKLDNETGKYYMIEANPRPWGPMQFVIDNQVDLFGALLSDCDFEINSESDNKEKAEYYFWSGGLAESAKPYAWHNYSEKEFWLEFSEIRKHDIYARIDSVELMINEMKNH